MHLALGMFSLERNHPDKYALSLLNVILGANMSSRLFDELREKRGLAYAIGSSAKTFKDTGMFLVRAGVDNKKIVDATALILKELGKIKRKNVTDGEFKRAKEYYLGQVLLGLEDTLDHMFWVGETTLLLERAQHYKEVIKKIRQVTITQIRNVARKIFDESMYNLSVVGPLNDDQEKKLSKLLNVGANS